MKVAFTGLQEQTRRLRAQIDARIARVLDHGQFIMGPEVLELEQRLAAFCGARYAVAVANGTDALQIALMAAGIASGDAVFLPSFTFTATAEVVLLLGAKPIFVEVDAKSCNIDCDDLERAIKGAAREGVRARAIIGVDLFGMPADWPRLRPLAREYGLFLLADAAQSFGARQGDERVGALAEATATSFFPAKPLGCFGDGGAIFTDDADLAALMRSIRVHGQGKEKYETARVGVNSRLDTLQAAILLAKLEVLDDEIAGRDLVAQEYRRQLSDVVETPITPPGHVSAWAQYTIKTPRRDELFEGLAKRGVPSAIYYPKPMHLQPAYAAHGAGEGSLPVSEALALQVLSLPCNAYASKEEAQFVCAAVKDVLRGGGSADSLGS